MARVWSTAQARGAVDGGGPLLLRAIVVVIPLLLLIAGDVETNPGPEGKYSSEEGELCDIVLSATLYKSLLNYTECIGF